MKKTNVVNGGWKAWRVNHTYSTVSCSIYKYQIHSCQSCLPSKQTLLLAFYDLFHPAHPLHMIVVSVLDTSNRIPFNSTKIHYSLPYILVLTSDDSNAKLHNTARLRFFIFIIILSRPKNTVVYFFHVIISTVRG